MTALTHTVKWTKDAEVASGAIFALTFDELARVRFDPRKFSVIQLSGSSASQIALIGTDATLRVIRFRVNGNILAGDQLVIAGVPLIVSNKIVGGEGIGFDIDNNGTADDYFPGRIRISDERNYFNDYLAPVEIFSASAVYSGQTLTVSGTLSGDIDFGGYQIIALNASGAMILNQFEPYSFPRSYALAQTPVSVMIKASDFQGNTSSGVLVPLTISVQASLVPSSLSTTGTVATSSGISDQSVVSLMTLKTVPLTAPKPRFIARSVTLKEEVHRIILMQSDLKAKQAYYYDTPQHREVRALRERVATNLLRIEAAKTPRARQLARNALNISVKVFVRAVAKIQ